jgi:hypothetical protein
MALPMSGAAWNALVSRAGQSVGTPDISNQDNQADITVLAKALSYARTGNATHRSQVVTALNAAINTENGGETLALGRNLGAYVLAADLIGYREQPFLSWVSTVRHETLDSRTLVSCHEDRPNNWGTHCGASRVIADLYIGDSIDLALAIKVWRGWLGDRAQYAGFDYGATTWQCNPSAPVGINGLGCTRNGYNYDGILPDDQRRGGGAPPATPACQNYVHEALQGVTLAGAILDRAGYDFWLWSDRAVARAYERMYEIWNCPASGDDTFAPFIVDEFAETNYSGGSPSQPGKGFGFSDWLWPS